LNGIFDKFFKIGSLFENSLNLKINLFLTNNNIWDSTTVKDLVSLKQGNKEIVSDTIEWNVKVAKLSFFLAFPMRLDTAFINNSSIVLQISQKKMYYWMHLPRLGKVSFKIGLFDFYKNSGFEIVHKVQTYIQLGNINILDLFFVVLRHHVHFQLMFHVGQLYKWNYWN
jgi:hypothetical protein